MELRHLRYFVAIAEHEHIGRAARVLHVSSSPLSRQIHQLEEDIGVRLLARVGRRVQLTEAGKVFHQEAREALARIDRAVATAQAASRGEVGRLRIAFVEVRRMAEIIPTAVRQFRARHPHVTLELVPMRMREQLEAFDAGRIDALEIDALLTFRVGREPPGFNVEPLFTERLELMVARDHALARQKRSTASAMSFPLVASVIFISSLSSPTKSDLPLAATTIPLTTKPTGSTPEIRLPAACFFWAS